ncbi:hypothetical protein FRB96_000400 [Tulasnella sp. 330]|nr:hypothetical protein FRB96_000400 [Tulasnella sp. 330]KAG8885346.1 hypothetical protein FRB97_001421 [Tulasnella sp. 331]
MDLSSQSQSIAQLNLYKNETHLMILDSQAQQRIRLVERWNIKPGERILEIGCGQGDCTAVLATTVGTTGHVIAIDPGPPDYGAPWTLAQAQSHLSKSAIGPQITWVNDDPIHHLKNLPSDEPLFDTAVLANCIWYMSSPSILRDILAVVSTRAKRVCIAEYSLNASTPAAFPHVLAVLAQAALETHKPISESNVRTVLSPRAIKKLVTEASTNIELEWEDVIVPYESVDDGRWEIDAVQNGSFASGVAEHVSNEREKASLDAMKDALDTAVKGVAALNGRCRTMDVWIASFHCRN